MNVNYVTTKPKCDICTRVVNEVIDAPTKAGPWAHMCPGCVKTTAIPGYKSIGSRVIYQPKKPEPIISDGPAMTVIERTSDESLLTKDRRVQCPKCKRIFILESDAEGTMPCEKCGQKLSYEARV